MDVINQLLKLVEMKLAVLVKLQREYNSLHQPDCTSCPGKAAYFEVRLELIKAHEQYRAALGLFLNALGWMKEREEDKKAKGPLAGGFGKEFVPGVKELRPHCEPWTVNGTKKPDNEVCAIICRNQPSCVGFAIDPKSDWCLWFDDTKPQSEDVCASQTKTAYIKKWQAPQNEQIWLSMEKIHVFDKAIVEALKLSEHNSETTNRTFMGWWDFDEGKNMSIKLELEDHFKENLDEYTGTILDTQAIRKQYLILQKSANGLMDKERHIHPALGAAAAPRLVDKVEPVEEAVAPEGFAVPLAEEPSALRWKDFPNSEDTAWSKIHPDCPMGAPCICDCKCRGPPPQNFVEPPAPPPLPCPPPPPLPNPAMLSAILTR
jgi:hypothetical protein